MKSFAKSDIGLVRASNQDTYFIADEPVGALPNLYFVADGMGGQAAGEYASAYTAEYFVRSLKQMDGKVTNHPELMMKHAAMEVNDELHVESSKEGAHKGTGTTLVAASVRESTVYGINIGDSRLYRIGDEIRQISQDHSYVEEMVRNGEMERGSEEYLNARHYITRAIGPWESIRVDTFVEHLKVGEGILLCSDGLTGAVPDERILEIFQQLRQENRLRECPERLIEEAKRCGSTDNITVVIAA